MAGRGPLMRFDDVLFLHSCLDGLLWIKILPLGGLLMMRCWFYDHIVSMMCYGWWFDGWFFYWAVAMMLDCRDFFLVAAWEALWWCSVGFIKGCWWFCRVHGFDEWFSDLMLSMFYIRDDEHDTSRRRLWHMCRIDATTPICVTCDAHCHAIMPSFITMHMQCICILAWCDAIQRGRRSKCVERYDANSTQSQQEINNWVHIMIVVELFSE